MMYLSIYSSNIFNRIIIILGFIVTGNIILLSQDYRFKYYGPEDGLTDNFIYTITQDTNGFLWLGTGEGILRFDGFNFISEFPGIACLNLPQKKLY